ncbi:MAG: iron-containing alcohol dehydrogenase [Christensenellaceae bacterium]|jgi:alcohol dehydrogenase YqhD (iron-dependent ADH family)|nr:iron-containing alcohol dehydrogenase [Christensenellaceae bacterium]
MVPFTYQKPTKIIYGPGQVAEIGNISAGYGKTALFIKGSRSMERNGVIGASIEALKAAGLRVHTIEGWEPNPKLTAVDAAIALARKEDVDLILAFGGGSAIDLAKAISIGVPYHGDVWGFFSGTCAPKAALPVGVVTTIAGAGSEAGAACVITCDRPGFARAKWNVFSPLLAPKFAILDAQLHVSVPPRLTAAGMIDMFAHACEAYFLDTSEPALQDGTVELIARTIIACEPVLKHPEDLALRGMLAWMSALSIDTLGNAGRSIKMGARWPGHTIQAGIGAITDTRHGDGLAVLLPACCLELNKRNPARTKKFAQNVFGIVPQAGMSDQDIGEAGCIAMRDTFRRWGLPTTFAEMGIDPNTLEVVVKNLKQYPNPGTITEEYVRRIFSLCAK